MPFICFWLLGLWRPVYVRAGTGCARSLPTIFGSMGVRGEMPAGEAVATPFWYVAGARGRGGRTVARRSACVHKPSLPAPRVVNSPRLLFHGSTCSWPNRRCMTNRR
jgi:hypothetical protein